MDNPPNKDMASRPVFDGSEWISEFILYCDAENDDILDRCTPPQSTYPHTSLIRMSIKIS